MKSPFIRRLALLAIILATAWFFGPKPERLDLPISPDGTRPPTSRTPSSQTTTPGAPSLAAGIASAPTPLPSARALAPGVAPAPALAPAVAPAPAVAGPTPDAHADVAVDQIRRMLRDYRTLTGENPVGTNAEIMRTLMGDNPRQAKLGPPEGQSLNDQGELVDPWGTPIFFHQLSKTLMEIRSAGPDKVMWTEDDIVAR